ncbi:hypothetical protein, partial [Mesorhizobium sp. M4A.F.Ca.ET.090.04.2.1]|uniref:hypothetical protein n=1 Tax=Mesorhizobium sp. M4A.F.Ca.ET.090.04.2.1 TaxID=2496663 RepID=UPI001AECFA11
MLAGRQIGFLSKSLRANHGLCQTSMGGPSHTPPVKASKRCITRTRFERKLCPLPGNMPRSGSNACHLEMCCGFEATTCSKTEPKRIP